MGRESVFKVIVESIFPTKNFYILHFHGEKSQKLELLQQRGLRSVCLMLKPSTGVCLCKLYPTVQKTFDRQLDGETERDEEVTGEAEGNYICREEEELHFVLITNRKSFFLDHTDKCADLADSINLRSLGSILMF